MQLTLPIIFGIALADSINPVSFGVLIELLKKKNKSSDIKEIGYQYITSFVITYSVVGISLLAIISLLAQKQPAILSILGAIIIVLGLVEINRLTNFSKKLLSLASLPQKRMHEYLDTFTNDPAGYMAIGITTALREILYTGSFYIGLVSLLAIDGNQDRFTYILFYNVIVAIPLLIILHSIKSKVDVKDFQLWNTQTRHPMMLGIAWLQVVLGIWLLFWWFV